MSFLIRIIAPASVALAMWGVYELSLYIEQREIDSWLRDTASIQDPWERAMVYNDPPIVSSATYPSGRVTQLRNTALEEAVAAGDCRAFDYASRLGFASIIDRHPRDPEARAKQLGQLSVAWPNIRSMDPRNRMLLVHFAEECHLQEARDLLPARSVVECVASRSNGSDGQMSALLRSAMVGGPVLQPMVSGGE